MLIQVLEADTTMELDVQKIYLGENSLKDKGLLAGRAFRPNTGMITMKGDGRKDG